MRLTCRRVMMALIAINVGAILMVLNSLVPKTTTLESFWNQPLRFPTPSPSPFHSPSPYSSPSRTTAQSPEVLQAVQDSHVNPCPQLSAPPADLRDNQTFYSTDESAKIYVHSAFYDNAGTAVVRLVVLRRVTPPPKSLQCQLWFQNQDPYLLVVGADYKRIPEEHGRRYGAAFLVCPLHGAQRPYAVSIVGSQCAKPTHALPVHYSSAILSNFTLCVTPLNFRYSRTYELVEMLEMNSILGADRFVFYNYSTSPNVDEVLRHYGSKGKVEVIQWHLPVKVDTWPPSGKPEVHYFGQLLALNDCLYRNLGRARYLVYSDLDEFLVPRKVHNWPALLSSEKKLKTTTVGAIIFRCAFFRKEWPLWEENFPGKERALRYNATTMLRVLREKFVLKASMRSKFMIQPEVVECVGIHNIWKYRNSFGHTLDPSVGMLHHYRSWEDSSDFKAKQMLDTHMFTYKDQLLDRLDQVWRELPVVHGDSKTSS